MVIRVRRFYVLPVMMSIFWFHRWTSEALGLRRDCLWIRRHTLRHHPLIPALVRLIKELFFIRNSTTNNKLPTIAGSEVIPEVISGVIPEVISGLDEATVGLHCTLTLLVQTCEHHRRDKHHSGRKINK